MVKERRARGLVKAIDTNVAVRILIRDDEVQTKVADAAVKAGVFIPLTVILETGWLLRSRYQLSRKDAAEALHALVDLPETMVADTDGVRWAFATKSSVRAATRARQPASSMKWATGTSCRSPNALSSRSERWLTLDRSDRAGAVP